MKKIITICIIFAACHQPKDEYQVAIPITTKDTSRFLKFADGDSISTDSFETSKQIRIPKTITVHHPDGTVTFWSVPDL